ncbi:hypothetical protein MHYP_G00324840 [Metynnis hypsauchen]
MKFELLLLLFALVGPFCAITHASTLVVPTAEDRASVTETVAEAIDATEPPKKQDTTVVPKEVVTEVSVLPATKAAVTETEAQVTDTEAPVVSTIVAPEEPAVTEAAPKLDQTTSVVETLAAVVTEVAVQTEEPEETEAKEEENAAPEAEAELEQETVTQADVEVEDSGLSTGHVVGIVIGALVAVVIIIAVIVVVVRRMGQYSP